MILLGQDPLDNFLKNNAKPQYLVLEYGVDGLHRNVSRSDMLPLNGLPALLRFYPAGVIIRTFLKHPEMFFDVMQFVYVITPQTMISNIRHRMPRLDARHDYSTHFTLLKAPLRDCRSADAEVGPRRLPDPSLLTEYRRKYSAAADHVLLEIAPTTTCDPQFQQDARLVAGATDNQYQQFPVALFNQAYVHFDEAGAARFSRELAEQILAIQAHSASRAFMIPNSR